MPNAYYNLRTSLDRFLIDWSMKNMSDYQGASLPTVSTFQGMIAYRSDQDKIYQLTVPPSTWVLLPSEYFIFDFDNHAVATAIPEKPLVGVKNFALRNEGGLFTVSAMIVMTLYNEPNMYKHNQLIGNLFESFYSGKRIPVQRYSDNSGTVFDSLVVMDTSEVLPTVNSNKRMIQAVGFTAGTGVSTT